MRFVTDRPARICCSICCNSLPWPTRSRPGALVGGEGPDRDEADEQTGDAQLANESLHRIAPPELPKAGPRNPARAGTASPRVRPARR
jgi:hypothetical protein